MNALQILDEGTTARNLSLYDDREGGEGVPQTHPYIQIKWLAQSLILPNNVCKNKHLIIIWYMVLYMSFYMDI